MMKPINTLSALVYSATLNKRVGLGESGSGVRRPSDVQSLNHSSNNPSPESRDSLADSVPKSIIGKMDTKSISARETPLRVFKSSPLSMIANNKVGASYSSQQTLMNQNSQQANGLQLEAATMALPVTARRVRDSGSLLFMIAFLGFLAYIVWDGLIVKEADINLIVHGHDSFGNICGRNNRAIKFVEKSGRNYSTRPFTKYTLINAQFERYTLDFDRLKHGELFYVKQHEPLKLGSLSGPEERVLRLRANQKPSPRVVRSAVFDRREQLYDRNQTLLKNLKSTLMYQYPPMYGYEQERQRQNIRSRSEGESTFNQDPQLEVAASLQRELSVTSARSSALATTVTPPHRPSTTQLKVVYDDHSNDTDHYGHMLVNPTFTNLRAKTPEGLNQNEVSSQLLYLTECVDQCPSDHVELIFYRCMPKNWRFSLFPNAINVTRTFIDEILTDLSQCYRELIYIFSFALVLSLALLILLRFLASIIIWSCLALLIMLLLSTASYSWMSYYNQIIDLNNAMPHDAVYSEKLASSDRWLVGAIFLTFVSFASIGTVIFMRKRILLVTMLFRESGKAIADMPLLLLQPLLTFAALLAITVVWSLGLICIQSIKSPVIDMSSGFVVFKAETVYKIMKWYHIFAFLWVSHFAIACQHYVIGASVSKWYFSANRYNLGSPIGSSVSELILYYLGSVALGSFLVAIFKVIRIITRQIQFLVQRNCMSANSSNGAQSLADSSATSSQVTTSCCGSFSYVWRMFIWFFDNIVMIINRDAYVEIAIYGHSFVSGAQRAFTVLASNPLKLLAVKSVSNVLLLMAKICVVFGTVSMAALLLAEKNQQLNYSWSPIVISAVYAYIVAHWFLSVYEMVIDALFICYCEDYERTKKQEAILSTIPSSEFMSHILSNNQLY